MKMIRRSVFETNSSSCHTLVLLSKDVPEIQRGYKSLSLAFGEYGWGYDIIDEPEEKLSYLLTYVVNYGVEEERQLFVTKLTEHFPELETISVGWDEYTMEEFTRAILNQTLDPKDSYIDHASEGAAWKILHNMSFSEYLSSDAILYIANDNSELITVNKRKARDLGISDEMAEELAGHNKPYQLSYTFKKKVKELGGVVL